MRDRAAGIELTKRLGGDVDAGEHAWRLREDDAAGAQRPRHGRLRRDVAPAEVLGERAPDGLAIERRLQRLERDRPHRRCSPAVVSVARARRSRRAILGFDDRAWRSVRPHARPPRPPPGAQRSCSAQAHDRAQDGRLQRPLFLRLLLADRAEHGGRELERPHVRIGVPARRAASLPPASATPRDESIRSATTTRLLR